MSRTAAIARARELRESLLDHGVFKVSIELVQGRAGSGWNDDHHVSDLGHHIVSRRSQGDTPFLHLVKVGRPGVPGPLCNGYGGWDEVARIICMGWANHPGRGGPMTVERGTIPRNNGRPYLFGWEFEGGLDPDDWPDSMHLFMARCLAGTLDWLGVTERSHAEHKTWAPTRKVDRLGYTAESARQLIKPILEGGDDMPDPRIPDDWVRTLELIHDSLDERDSNGSAVGFIADLVKTLRGYGLTPIEAAHVVGALSQHRIPGGRKGWDAWAEPTRKYSEAADLITDRTDPDALVEMEELLAVLQRVMAQANPKRHREIREKAGL